MAESCEEMPRYVRCENCNKKLRGSDKVIVDNNSIFPEILFCSKKCQQQFYYPVDGQSHVTTVDKYWNI